MEPVHKGEGRAQRARGVTVRGKRNRDAIHMYTYDCRVGACNRYLYSVEARERHEATCDGLRKTGMFCNG